MKLTERDTTILKTALELLIRKIRSEPKWNALNFKDSEILLLYLKAMNANPAVISAVEEKIKMDQSADIADMELEKILNNVRGK